MTYTLVSSLFNDMQNFRREVDSFFATPQPRAGIRNAWGVGAPPVSIGETPEDVRLQVFAPGLDEKSIDVTIQGNLLRVGAIHKPRHSEEAALQKRVTVFRNERNGGRFSRLVTLPDSVDPGQVHASYEDGVLTVLVGKRPEEKPRRIEINAR